MIKKLNHHHKIIFGLAGFSGSGKTTLSQKLIKEFSKLKISVASIKHAHHSFEIDKPQKDSWKHREAGSEDVIVSSSSLMAHIQNRKNKEEASLKELLNIIPPKQIVLIEGYKKENIPKIEVFRKGMNTKLLAKNDNNIFAIATDIDVDDKIFKNIFIAILPLNDSKYISKFIINHFKKLKSYSIKKNKNIITFDKAKNLIFDNINCSSNNELIPIEKSSNRILEKNIKSKINLPPNPNSAVDGYGFNFKNYNFLKGSNFSLKTII